MCRAEYRILVYEDSGSVECMQDIYLKLFGAKSPSLFARAIIWSPIEHLMSSLN